MPAAQTMRNWLASNTEFAEIYNRARSLNGEAVARDQIQEIIDDFDVVEFVEKTLAENPLVAPHMSQIIAQHMKHQHKRVDVKIKMLEYDYPEKYSKDIQPQENSKINSWDLIGTVKELLKELPQEEKQKLLEGD